MKQPPATINWIGEEDGYLQLLDQTRLPEAVSFLDCRDVESVWQAIKRLSVRGAPAIGVAAGYGCVIGAQQGRFAEAADYLATSRPTAVNLFWAIARMKRVGQDDPSVLLTEARAIHREDQAMCEAIGRHGAALIPTGGGVLTHCNAGALATSGIGTATAPMYAAHAAGRGFSVFADETRPLLQGARLTAWELGMAGIQTTVICDSMAATVLREGRVDLVITGADRIAANGDIANKIGTYPLAVLARHHRIPFYVAAPSTSFDLELGSGDLIPIEQREGREITHGFGQATAPDFVKTYNPAFDVTPAELVTAIITEKGLIDPVNRESIAAMIRAD